VEPGAKVLITGGVAAIALSLLLGLDLSRRRQRQPAAEVHAWLTAHQTILFQGFMMLGLSLAAGFSKLSSTLVTAAAWLIVAGASFSALAQISNARQGVKDQFAERSLGLRLNTMQAIVLLPGVLILFVGVVRAL
jgi:hypothetical protein